MGTPDQHREPVEPEAEVPAPPATEPEAPERSAAPSEPAGGKAFIAGRTHPRRRAESVLVRLVSTAGIVGVSVAIAAILGTQDVAAWVIGLVVSLLSVVLAAVLWSSRNL